MILIIHVYSCMNLYGIRFIKETLVDDLKYIINAVLTDRYYSYVMQQLYYVG